MKIVALHDKLSEVESLSQYKEVVYHYTDMGYNEGTGQLLGFDGSKFYLYDLGHCSCYGPLEDDPVTEYTIIELSNIIYSENVLDSRDIMAEIVNYLRIE